MILYSHNLYSFFAARLDIFERNNVDKKLGEFSVKEQGAVDIIIFGLGRFGRVIADTFKQEGYSVLGVDIDLDRVRKSKIHGMNACYGDAEDPEFISSLPISHARWIVGAIYGRSR